MFFIAALTVSLILCCIYCHAFDDRAITMTIRDCEDLEDINVLCLKSFSVVLELSKLN